MFSEHPETSRTFNKTFQNCFCVLHLAKVIKAQTTNIILMLLEEHIFHTIERTLARTLANTDSD